MSNRSIDRSTIIFCIVGAAASGKTTLVSKLRTDFASDMQRAVTVTSRAMRENETQGDSYIFVSRSEFEARVAAGEFFEWEETHGNLYGTLRAKIEEILASSRDLILDIDIRGARNFRAAWPQRVVTVLIVPPSSQELLKRLKARGVITTQELNARLNSAEREYNSYREMHRSGEVIDYLIINDELEAAYAALKAVVVAERSKISRRSGEFIARLCSVSRE